MDVDIVKVAVFQTKHVQELFSNAILTAVGMLAIVINFLLLLLVRDKACEICVDEFLMKNSRNLAETQTWTCYDDTIVYEKPRNLS